MRTPKTHLLYLAFDEIQKRKQRDVEAVTEKLDTSSRTKINSRSEASNEYEKHLEDEYEEEDISAYRCDEEGISTVEEWSDIDNFWNQEGVFDDEASHVQESAIRASYNYFDELEIDQTSHEQEDWDYPDPENEKLQDDYALEEYADYHYGQYDFFFRKGDICSHSGYSPTERDATTLLFTDMLDPDTFVERLDWESRYLQCLENSGFIAANNCFEVEAPENSLELELHMQMRYWN